MTSPLYNLQVMGLPQTQLPPLHRVTVEDYLRLEDDATQRHEYRDGEVLAMAGGTLRHSRITTNAIRAVGDRIEGGPCAVYDSNLRVRIPRKTLYTYPDAFVLCGEPQYDPLDTKFCTVLNPRVVIEVLSESTEAYDRGEKFQRYREIESLEEYVLVSQSSATVETFLRQPHGGWLLTAAIGLESTAVLRSIRVDIPLAKVYAGVTFPPAEAEHDEPARPAPETPPLS